MLEMVKTVLISFGILVFGVAFGIGTISLITYFFSIGIVETLFFWLRVVIFLILLMLMFGLLKTLKLVEI